jgi:hypothetical protein
MNGLMVAIRLLHRTARSECGRSLRRRPTAPDTFTLFDEFGDTFAIVGIFGV